MARVTRVRVRLLTLAAILLLWLIMSAGSSSLGFPGPIRVGEAFFALLASGELVVALSATLGSFVAGAGLAFLVGIPLGILMGVQPLLGRAIDPYLTGLYIMPFSAVIPLLVLWFGIDEFVRVVFIFLFTLPQIAIVCYQGARETPTTLVEVARTLQASDAQIFRKLVLPHEVGYVFTALRLGTGLAIQGMVVSELLIASVRGLGNLIRLASARLDLASVLAVVLFVMLLGIAAVSAMQRLENAVAPWRRHTTITGDTHA
jgi:ABC-type nitrate/sulfonate/bicarbonate transport system permease component